MSNYFQCEMFCVIYPNATPKRKVEYGLYLGTQL